MKILFLLLLTACNLQGQAGQKSDPSAEKAGQLISKHYKVTILSSSTDTFSGEMCGQAFQGNEFECDYDRVSLTTNQSGIGDYRLIIEVDGESYLDEEIRPNAFNEVRKYEERF